MIIRVKTRRTVLGQRLLIAGMLFSAAAILLGWSRGLSLPEIILPALLVLIGVPLMLTGHKIVLDLSRHNVLQKNGDPIPFDDIADVVLRSYVKEVSTAQGTNMQQRFIVGLVPKQANPELAAVVAESRKLKDDALTDQKIKMNTEMQARLDAGLERIRPISPDEVTTVADGADELDMWRVAERLAKAIDVPITDFCGDKLVIRTPAELDMPLGTRLARTHFKPHDPGAPPSGIVDDSSDDGTLRFAWKRPGLGRAITLSTFGALLCLCGWLTWEDMFEIRVGFAAAGGACLLAALYVLAGTVRRLDIDSEAARYRARIVLPRVTIPIKELEMIRVSETPAAMSLISDERVVRCTVAPDVGDWMRQRIENFLVGKPHE